VTRPWDLSAALSSAARAFASLQAGGRPGGSWRSQEWATARDLVLSFRTPAIARSALRLLQERDAGARFLGVATLEARVPFAIAAAVAVEVGVDHLLALGAATSALGGGRRGRGLPSQRAKEG
jgi:hypothetical protein